MLGFWFKKNFCDAWDNLFHMIVPNLVMLVSIIGVVFMCIGVNAIPVTEAWRNVFSFIALFIAIGIVCVFIFAESDNCAKIANFEAPSLKNYFKQIVPCIKDGLFFGFVIAFLVSIITISFPYYFRVWVPADGSKGSIFGLICMSVVFWFVVISILALQWFIPIRSLMHNNFKKCLKKSYIIFFDNPGFSIIVALNNLLLLIITVVCFGMAPSFTGMMIANTDALRLRLYKYDWYEVNPGMTKEQRKQVPWEDLLANDKEVLGPRKFKSFIFPWKE